MEFSEELPWTSKDDTAIPQLVETIKAVADEKANGDRFDRSKKVLYCLFIVVCYSELLQSINFNLCSLKPC